MIAFGKRIEPMTDLYLIDEMKGVRFTEEKPIPVGKVLDFDKPWEREGSLGLTAFDDDGTVKLYYRGFPIMTDAGDYNEGQTACIAASRDGIRFERVPVNTISYDGITENNIVEMGVHCHNFAAFRDRNPACREEERYKAICGLKVLGGLFAYASADGLHWHKMAEEPVITNGAFDSMNIALYDAYADCYRCYSRVFIDGLRCIQSCTSNDFIHWTDPVPNEYPDPTPYKEHLYTNAAAAIPGAEHLLISIPMRFREERVTPTRVGEGSGYSSFAGTTGISDGVLMTSRDGVHWDRKLKEAYFSGSLYPHEWTQRNFISLAGIIVRGNDFYFYTEQNYMWDDDGIYLYKTPLYRFMSLYADEDAGVIVSKPLHFETDSFYVNFATSAYGTLTAELLDEEKNPVGEPQILYGNDLAREVKCGALAGKNGYLRITLQNAHLYALGSAPRF